MDKKRELAGLVGKGVRYGALALVTAPVWVPVLFAGYVGLLASRAAFRHPWKTLGAIAVVGTLAYGAHRGTLQRGWHELRDAHEDKVRISQLEEQLERRTAIYDELSRKADLGVRNGLETHLGGERNGVRGPSGMSEVNYYVVKQDETLSSIATYVGASGYERIAQVNGIHNPRDLMVGQLLRIPREECRRYRSDVYVRPPALKSTVLPGSVKISEWFSDPGAVLATNRELGLRYADAFKYPHGKRVVWFREE